MEKWINIALSFFFIECLNSNVTQKIELDAHSLNRSGLFYRSGFYSYSIDWINPEYPTEYCIVKIKFEDNVFLSSIYFINETDTVFAVVPKEGIVLHLTPNNYNVIAFRGTSKIDKNKMHRGYVEFNFDMYSNEQVSLFISLGYGGIY